MQTEKFHIIPTFDHDNNKDDGNDSDNDDEEMVTYHNKQ